MVRTGNDPAGEPDVTDAPRKRRRPEPTPAQRALGLLVRREHSRKELARKLSARGMAGDDVSTAVERMAREGWQDDVRFAAFLARSRAMSGYGPIRIRAELGTHGLDEPAVTAAFAALAASGEDDWVASARDLVRRRFGLPAAMDAARRRRASDFLLRRGFDGETVRSATRADARSDQD